MVSERKIMDRRMVQFGAQVTRMKRSFTRILFPIDSPFAPITSQGSVFAHLEIEVGIQRAIFDKIIRTFILRKEVFT